MSTGTDWPALPYDEWSDTLGTLHMVLQIIGKVRVALSPKEPEWAHITLYVTARGLTTGPVPSNVGLVDVEADLLHHEVVIRTADGEAEAVPLRARPVAEFWTAFNAALQKLGIEVELSPEAQEVPDPIPFPDDTTHASYDPAAATRFWRALSVIEPVFAVVPRRVPGQGLAGAVLLGERRPRGHALLRRSVRAAPGGRHADA